MSEFHVACQNFAITGRGDVVICRWVKIILVMGVDTRIAGVALK